MGMQPLKGFHQKPVWITNKDINNSHWLFKSHHSTNLSAEAEQYKGYDLQGGPNWTKLRWWRRAYRGNVSLPVSLERQQEEEWFLASPYGPVGATGTGGTVAPAVDAIIGPDYNVPSEDYLQKMNVIIPKGMTSGATASANQGIYTRVIGAKHTFYFTNYTRFPIEIRMVYDPYPSSTSGEETPSGIMDACSRYPGTSALAGTNDKNYENIKRIADCTETIVIPPVLDNNDSGKTAYHTIKYSPKEHVPEHFMLSPVDGVTSIDGLWRIVNPERFDGVSGQGSVAVGQGTRLSPWLNDSPDHGSGSAYRMKTAVHLYARLLTPHGAVLGTVPDVSGGVLGNYRAMDVSVKSSFINEVMMVGTVRPQLNGVMDDFVNTNAAS